MATQQAQQTGMSSADGSVVGTDNKQEKMMNEVVTSGALRANCIDVGSPAWRPF